MAASDQLKYNQNATKHWKQKTTQIDAKVSSEPHYWKLYSKVEQNDSGQESEQVLPVSVRQVSPPAPRELIFPPEKIKCPSAAQ